MKRSRIQIPQTLVETRTRHHGEDGRRWAEKLPDIVSEAADRWGLSLLHPFSELRFNYVTLVELPTGEPAVLKIGYPDPNGDFEHEQRCLQEFQGGTSVRLLDSDMELCALLLERLEPGITLAELTDDAEATSIAATVMHGLWRPPPDDYLFPQARQWIEAACSPSAIPTRKREMPWAQPLLEEAADLASEAAHKQLLHGDLHHENILAAQRQSWLAIDPKGVIGNPAWELAPFLFNNLESASNSWRALLRRRLDQLSEELSLDRRSAYVLSAVRSLQARFWSLRDDIEPRSTIVERAYHVAEELAKGP